MATGAEEEEEDDETGETAAWDAGTGGGPWTLPAPAPANDSKLSKLASSAMWLCMPLGARARKAMKLPRCVVRKFAGVARE